MKALNLRILKFEIERLLYGQIAAGQQTEIERLEPAPLFSARFDVVVNDYRSYDEHPHGENSHTRDGFGNQAWQDSPSPAEN